MTTPTKFVFVAPSDLPEGYKLDVDVGGSTVRMVLPRDVKMGDQIECKSFPPTLDSQCPASVVSLWQMILNVHDRPFSWPPGAGCATTNSKITQRTPQKKHHQGPTDEWAGWRHCECYPLRRQHWRQNVHCICIGYEYVPSVEWQPLFEYLFRVLLPVLPVWGYCSSW